MRTQQAGSADSFNKCGVVAMCVWFYGMDMERIAKGKFQRGRESGWGCVQHGSRTGRKHLAQGTYNILCLHVERRGSLVTTIGYFLISIKYTRRGYPRRCQYCVREYSLPCMLLERVLPIYRRIRFRWSGAASYTIPRDVGFPFVLSMKQ